MREHRSDLQVLQLETPADNVPMITAATKAGIAVEGTLRRSAWVCGEFIDEVVPGFLAEECSWSGRPNSRISSIS